MSRQDALREVLELLAACPQGPWRASAGLGELREKFQNIDVMDGDHICRPVGFLTLPGAEQFAPAIVAAVNFLREHGPALLSGGGDGWIAWEGGVRPVDPDTTVEVELRDGERGTKQAGAWFWKHHNEDDDIVAYRVVSTTPETSK